jgi:uncharacterized protein (TIGR02145 family)
MKSLAKILKNSLVILLLLLVQSCNKEANPEIIIERGTVVDIDGNIYETVKIGDQWWMAENLKVKRYNNGNDLFTISLTEADSVWTDCLIGAYCTISDSIYGALYNYAAIQDARKLAPEGWHIPSDVEWKTLEKTIGMQQNQVDALAWRGTNEAEKLMNKSLVGWPQASIAYGSDLYGFAAIAGGCRLQNGYTNQEKNTAFFWSSSIEGNFAWYRYLDAQKKTIFRQKVNKAYGMSIRCVKD